MTCCKTCSTLKTPSDGETVRDRLCAHCLHRQVRSSLVSAAQTDMDLVGVKAGDDQDTVVVTGTQLPDASSLTNGNSAALLIAALTASHCLQVCAVLQCCVMCLLQNSVQNSLCLQIVFAMLNSVYTCFGMQTVQTVSAMRCR